MQLQKEMLAEHFRRLESGAGDRRAGRLHVRAGEPDGADPLLRRPARPARDQRAAVGHARQEPGLHRGGREGGPLGGRLLVRQVRPRDVEGRQHRPDRDAAAEARPAAALVHGLLHLHEVVRAPARGVRLPDGVPPGSVPGRRRADARAARVRCAPDPREPDPGAREGHRAARYDEDRLRESLAPERGAEDDLVAVLQSAKKTPPPDRRLLRRRLLRRPDLLRLPRHAGGRRVLPGAARGGRGARRPRRGPDDAVGPPRPAEVPPRRRGPAQLDALPRVLEDVLRRGGGRRRLDLLQGRRDLRLRLPPRPGRSARHARRLLQRLLHEPESARARRRCWRVTPRSTGPTGS